MRHKGEMEQLVKVKNGEGDEASSLFTFLFNRWHRMEAKTLPTAVDEL